VLCIGEEVVIGVVFLSGDITCILVSMLLVDVDNDDDERLDCSETLSSLDGCNETLIMALSRVVLMSGT
jgi:hypothetical protein